MGRTVKGFNFEIPLLGFGLMRLPMTDQASGTLDMEHVSRMVDKYMQAGFNYFDTAYVYHDGKSEVAFKEAVLKRYPRNGVLLADKMPIWNVNEPADLEKIFAEQLERTGAGYFDFYLLHSVGRSHAERAEKFGAYEFLKNKKAQGLIRHLGFSFHDSPEFLDEFLTKHSYMEFVQLQINYLDWVDETFSDKLFAVAEKHGKQVIVMEPVKGGLLANPPDEAKKLLDKAYPGKSYASFALRYVASLPNIITVLSGMSNMEQMEDNIATVTNFEPVTAEDGALLDSVIKILKDAAQIPCTNCKYCKDCPANIDIPGNFANYNKFKRDLDLNAAKSRYLEINPDNQAKQCLACGQCESICPQKIEIIKNLKRVAGRFAAE